MERDEDQQGFEPSEAIEGQDEVAGGDSQATEDVVQPDAALSSTPQLPAESTGARSAPEASFFHVEEADARQGDIENDPSSLTAENPLPQAEAVTSPSDFIATITPTVEGTNPPNQVAEAAQENRSPLPPVDNAIASQNPSPTKGGRSYIGESSRPGGPETSGPQVASPSPDANGSSERALPIPRVQVLVSMFAARVALEEVVAAAAEKMAPKFQKLAGLEVEQAAWVRKCEERAADYRLRGPYY